jgi:hypothetical protein
MDFMMRGALASQLYTSTRRKEKRNIRHRKSSINAALSADHGSRQAAPINGMVCISLWETLDPSASLSFLFNTRHVICLVFILVA